MIQKDSPKDNKIKSSFSPRENVGHLRYTCGKMTPSTLSHIEKNNACVPAIKSTVDLNHNVIFPPSAHVKNYELTTRDNSHSFGGASNNTKSLKVCVWNIHGLSQCKLSDSLLGPFLQRSDILCFTESWTNTDSDFQLPGFEFMNFPRNFKYKDALRCSGGISISIRRSLIDGVKLHKYYKVLQRIFWLAK